MDLKPKTLFKRVIDFARGGRMPAQLPRIAPVERLPAPAEARTEASADPVDDDVRGLEVAHHPEGGSLVLRWSVRPEEVARAGALVAGQPVLCLRVVSFSKVRDDVLREVQDRPNIDLRGQAEIAEPAQRAVVALGVRVGDRFVSIAHHIV